ncbi:hypothetical protein EXIGLDRAFT_769949 [Exidia glandulosa HHB12029]|uniref:Uncharacterized protein n=1 Tax=Exidia glandulosa HHB12029 TaxID=1314781 RepID=A0A165H3U7_EXIGL|nr:hypothetical protein EXIGLDRAFT_769949 [Exidia glandulosa HHB12029]
MSVHDVREECRNDDQLAASFGGLDLRGDQSGHHGFEIDHSKEMQRLDTLISDLIRDVELDMNGSQVAIPDDTEDEQPVLLRTQSNTHTTHWMFDVPKPTTPVDMHTFRNPDVYPSFAQVAQSFTANARADGATHIPENNTQDAFDMDGMSTAIEAVARSKTRNARRMTPEETAARKQAARVAKRERQSLITEADPRRADARRERASRRAASTPSTPGQKKTYRRRSGSSEDTTCSSSSTSAEVIPVLVINTKTRTVSVSRSSPAGSLPRSTTGAKRSSTSRAEKNAVTSPYPRTRPERKDKKDKNKNKLPKRDDEEEKPKTSLIVADADYQQMCAPRNVVENSPEMDAIAQQFERASFTDAAPAVVSNEVPAALSSPSELVEETPAPTIPVHEIYDGVQSIQEYAVDYVIGDFGLDFTAAAHQLFDAYPELDDEDMLDPPDARPTEWHLATPSESEPEPEPESVTTLPAYHLNLMERYPSGLVPCPYNHYDRLETCKCTSPPRLLDWDQIFKGLYKPKIPKAKTMMTSHGVRYQPYARRAPVAACAAY